MSKKGERRRTEIIAAAVEIFARDGFNGASFASVAEAVDLTLPGLLHYFPNKVDLLLEVLEWRDDNSGIPANSAAIGWRDMLEQLQCLNRKNAGMPGVVRVFSILNAEALTENHPASDWFDERFSRIRDIMAGSFARGIAAGEITTGVDPEMIANEVIAFMDGLQVAWLRSPDKVDMVKSFDSYVTRLIRSIETGKD
ncbi:TetR/AcrR family transcriptional regulator [uncultured Martelella sp.]|uniref:TetR/AcrR family transcriptional regulator n=1 Tax=uncultured Martelella sp. TaxID=392331 RepID=UPI0029C673FC|nr:TetR/AcrR family transcriptional regulator [uncultured Martelella sp.]